MINGQQRHCVSSLCLVDCFLKFIFLISIHYTVLQKLWLWLTKVSETSSRYSDEVKCADSEYEIRFSGSTSILKYLKVASLWKIVPFWQFVKKWSTGRKNGLDVYSQRIWLHQNIWETSLELLWPKSTIFAGQCYLLFFFLFFTFLFYVLKFFFFKCFVPSLAVWFWWAYEIGFWVTRGKLLGPSKNF